ncbi:uncharacterized protein NPIL_15051 [Nephila pilipes]|uniref:Uncharacterized protein n=1 Tax=Nephila pilipes TaxID=299642 RepID=A0A8X6QEZ0_NEPPI|nr:uncharacterized protein NPIL_15051 [Nephila pilipes]
MYFLLVFTVLLSASSIAWSKPMHGFDSLFERYEPWNMRYREEEKPQIFVEPNWLEVPQVIGKAIVMNGSTESTSTEQFTTITTLFYGNCFIYRSIKDSLRKSVTSQKYMT